MEQPSPQVAEGAGYTRQQVLDMHSHSKFIAPDIETAVARVPHVGAQVVYCEMPATMQKVYTEQRLNPIGNYSHMLDPATEATREQLIDEFNECVKSSNWDGVDKAMKALSKVAPGLHTGGMINSYTTPLHHAALELPVIQELFKLLHGEQDFRYLHNRMAFRSKSAKKYGPLKIADANLHKEGFEGDFGFMACLEGERCFTCIPNDQLAPPGVNKFRKIDLAELADCASEVVSLQIKIPKNHIAIILFDHYNAHGVDPRGEGIQLYLSACDDAKIAELDKARNKMLKTNTHVNKHAPEFRDPDDTYSDTVIFALLLGICDQFWPSGKPIYAHGAHQQSVKHNRRKFVDGCIRYTLPEGGQVPSSSKRKRMEDKGFRLPEKAWQLPWRVDAEDPEQVPDPKRWRLLAPAEQVSPVAPKLGTRENPVVLD